MIFARSRDCDLRFAMERVPIRFTRETPRGSSEIEGKSIKLISEHQKSLQVYGLIQRKTSILLYIRQ